MAVPLDSNPDNIEVQNEQQLKLYPYINVPHAEMNRCMRLRTVGKLKLLVLSVGITGPDLNVCSVCILATVHINTLVVSTGPSDRSCRMSTNINQC